MTDAEHLPPPTAWIERAPGASGTEPGGTPRLAVKANIAVAGFNRSGACPVFADDLQQADASVVAALRVAGARVVGTTNMHELAFGITGTNAAFGPTAVPGFSDRSAGGSSGGAAAVVASGDADVSLGSDTGGSVSIPASLCGVIGLRPTTGRWPTDGLLGLSWTRDTPGVFARTLREVAWVDTVVTGIGVRDARDAAVEAGRPRIGVPSLLLERLAPATRRAVDGAWSRLAGVADLIELDETEAFERARAAEMPVVGWESPRLLASAAAAHLGLPPDAALRVLVDGVASADVRAVLEAFVAHPITADAYATGRRDLALARERHAELFASHGLDAIAFPATPAPAPPIGTRDTVEHLGEQVAAFELYTRNTGQGTILGAPMLTRPLPVGERELPVGLTLQGARWRDRELLALAARLERDGA